MLDTENDLNVEEMVDHLVRAEVLGEYKLLEDQRPTFIKADQHKARFDLIPPEFMLELARVLTYGANKYSAHNWANGADWSRYFSAAQRHLWAWQQGEDHDEETGYSHLAHAACCLAFLLSYQHRDLGNDDRFYTVTDKAYADKYS